LEPHSSQSIRFSQIAIFEPCRTPYFAACSSVACPSGTINDSFTPNTASEVSNSDPLMYSALWIRISQPNVRIDFFPDTLRDQAHLGRGTVHRRIPCYMVLLQDHDSALSAVRWLGMIDTVDQKREPENRYCQRAIYLTDVGTNLTHRRQELDTLHPFFCAEPCFSSQTRVFALRVDQDNVVGNIVNECIAYEDHAFSVMLAGLEAN
ncbi:hypothetical protein KCU90_g16, partial [Aureobasidium melanogenum]